MTEQRYNDYLGALKAELIPALGCTEPIAIALAAAEARKLLGRMPEKMLVFCSGNMIKNVKAVTVPNSGGLKGIDVAAILGAVGGDPDRELEVLVPVTDEDRAETKRLLELGICENRLKENVNALYVEITAEGGGHTAEVTVAGKHTHFARKVLDGEVFLQDEVAAQSNGAFEDWMTVKEIIEFAENVNIDELEDTIGQQIRCNTEISDYGLNNKIGAEVGRNLLRTEGESVSVRARARAAAGSDARMSGCALPVVINSGSGNQGITIAMPIIEYAESLNTGKDKLYRALCIANLLAMHIKKYIGPLSSFCGAVTAASSAGAAITWLKGGDYGALCGTLTNTLMSVSGMICDGAKPSCASKIASAVGMAILAGEMSLNGDIFEYGEGLVGKDIEETIRQIGYVARIGMHPTDIEILKIMTGETKT